MEDYQKNNSVLSLSEFVKKKGKELNLSQVDLADKAGNNDMHFKNFSLFKHPRKDMYLVLLMIWWSLNWW